MARRTADATPPLEANRRTELLRAAARLFVEQGFAATTTRDIARAVGMRSGSPFYHFRSKQELLKAVIIEGLEGGHARVQVAIAGIDDPVQRLRVLVRTHLGNLLEGDCHAPLLINEGRSLEAAARAQIAAAFDRYQQPWQATLDELANRQLIASAAPPVRLFLFGMLNWTSQWYRSDGALTLDQLTDQALVMLLAPRSIPPAEGEGDEARQADPDPD